MGTAALCYVLVSGEEIDVDSNREVLMKSTVRCGVFVLRLNRMAYSPLPAKYLTP